jgi:hypothetical protein
VGEAIPFGPHFRELFAEQDQAGEEADRDNDAREHAA